MSRRTDGGELERRLRRLASERLAQVGVGETEVVVERRDAQRRQVSGNLHVVLADPAARRNDPGHSRPGPFSGRDGAIARRPRAT